MAATVTKASSSEPHMHDVEMVDRKTARFSIGEMPSEPVVEVEETSDIDDPDFQGTKSTNEDKTNMERMGKKQQLIRHFRFFSMVSFTAMSTAAWEIGIFVTTQGLVDGGRAGLIYGTIWNFVGFCPIYLSMAEMASMAPTCGGQYHWVSEFSPPGWQKWLSYITGWTSTVGWQAGNALGVFLTGTLLQVVILENNPEYPFPAWQGSLFTMATILIVGCINVFGSKLIPKLQNAFMILHVLGYLCFIIPIWVNAPKASFESVSTEFSNGGGWSTLALSVLVGQLSGTYTQIGVDTAAHMAEEVKDASKIVPRVMMSVWVINFCLIFPAIVTLCYAMPDLDAALSDPSAYPAVYVLRQSMSPAWTTVVLMMIICLLTWANVTYLTAVARDLFAFSRDGGFPFSEWLSRVHPTRHIPVNAVIATSIFSFILSLIYIGSPVAFYAISSLLVVALLQCYMFSISSILWRRLRHPESLPPAQFSLGKWGVPINIAAVTYSTWAFFWAFWPIATPVTAVGFNWAVVIFVGVLIFAMIFYVFKGRSKYHGPVVLVRQE